MFSTLVQGRKKRWASFLCVATLLLLALPVVFQTKDADIPDTIETLPADDMFFIGKVVDITPEEGRETMSVHGYSGPFKNKLVSVIQEEVRGFKLLKDIRPKTFIVVYYHPDAIPPFSLISELRLHKLLIILILFVGLVLLFIRKKGIAAMLSLIGSVSVIIFFTLPLIANGKSPALVCLGSALIILSFSIFLAHGISTKTIVAYISGIITLLLVSILGYIATLFLHLTGTGSTEAYNLQFGRIGHVNLKGLFLGSILISIVGVMDDVTVVQTASIEEIKKIEPNATKSQLLSAGFSIGAEHVISMVNTLFIVYLGSMIPLLLYFVYDRTPIPLWVRLNNEQILEEIVRSTIGSIGLLLAVPLTTVLAAHVYSKMNQPDTD